MVYTLDAEQKKKVQSIPVDVIYKSGIYTGQIWLARACTSTTGSTGIRLFFKTKEGLKATITLYTHTRTGKKTKAYNLLQSLMIVLGATRLLPTTVEVTERDYRRKKDVQVFRTCYLELQDKDVKLELSVEKYYKSKKYPTMSYGLLETYDAETNQTATEIIENLPAISIQAK